MNLRSRFGRLVRCWIPERPVGLDMGARRKLRRLELVASHDVHYRNSLHQQIVGNDTTMAAPRHRRSGGHSRLCAVRLFGIAANSFVASRPSAEYFVWAISLLACLASLDSIFHGPAARLAGWRPRNRAPAQFRVGAWSGLRTYSSPRSRARRKSQAATVDQAMIGSTLGRYMALRFAKTMLATFAGVFALIFSIDLVETLGRTGKAH
jgi:hypothetical protein